MIAVEKGWQGRNEVNRVTYAPQQVTLEQLEAWLRQAGTYNRTLEPNKRARGDSR